MKIYVGDRGDGKTHALIEWVKEGQTRASYPGWTRVLITHTLREAERLRGYGNPYRLDYRQVFSVHEWRTGRFVREGLQIAVDNVDLVLNELLGNFYPNALACSGEAVLLDG
jgi:hypothetical protein